MEIALGDVNEPSQIVQKTNNAAAHDLGHQERGSERGGAR